MQLVFDSFTDCYVSLANLVYHSPDFISKPRGKRVREKLGVKFTITNPRHRIPYVPTRKFSVFYMVGELLWYLSGENSTDWISYYSSFWKNISDDGKTANSAYGSRLFKPHPRIADAKFIQWQYIIDELRRDPDSRRAVVHIRVPDDSIEAKLDVPCTLTLQYFLRDNALYQIVNMRSSDLILGIAYDIPAFTFFQEMLANELGVELGTYTHISNSLHIYERHFDMVKEMLIPHNLSEARMSQVSRGPMPSFGHDIPIREMMIIDRGIRECLTEEAVKELINEFAMLENDNIDFWIDWMKVAGSYKLKKMGMLLESREMLSSTKFVGYHQLKGDNNA